MLYRGRGLPSCSNIGPRCIRTIIWFACRSAFRYGISSWNLAGRLAQVETWRFGPNPFTETVYLSSKEIEADCIWVLGQRKRTSQVIEWKPTVRQQLRHLRGLFVIVTVEAGTFGLRNDVGEESGVQWVPLVQGVQGSAWFYTLLYRSRCGR